MKKFLISFFIFFVGMVFGLALPPLFKSIGVHHGLNKDDILPELIKVANSPIQYDKEVEEYQLVYETQENNKKISHFITLRFSPFTGEKLTSGRDKLFTKPSPSEIQRIKSKIQGTKTLEEIEQILGKPDSVFNGKPMHHAFSGKEVKSDIKTQYTYSNLSDSTEVVITLHDDGKLSTYYSGKYIGKKKKLD
ncbi:MAG: hypothetical protein ABSF79_12030 [Smithellaceae bacterium]|jgi:hypothetical protein